MTRCTSARSVHGEFENDIFSFGVARLAPPLNSG